MPDFGSSAARIIVIVHYFPPINSAGAKRMEAMAKYFAKAGRSVTIVTTRKTAADGEFTEPFPPGIVVHELDWLGRARPSVRSQDEQLYPTTKKARRVRKLKDFIMRWLGQIPDPRLPFAFSLLSPFLDPGVRSAFRAANIIVGSCPPWPTLLAAFFAHLRFGKPMVLDYRDHFSFCHEIPGSKLAKTAERWIDHVLASRAAGLVTISEPMAEYYAQFNSRVAVVLNGYDPEIMDEVREKAQWQPRVLGSPLTIRYLGIITPGRVPRNLLAALVSLDNRTQIDKSGARFEFYGECALLKTIISEEYPSLLRMFVFQPRVRYRESLRLAATADHLLFCETPGLASASERASAQGVLTTKLFEYLASGRPILAEVDPNMLASQIIRKAGPHHFISQHADAFEELILSEEFWKPAESLDPPFVKTLSRASQAAEYLHELDSIIIEHKR